MIWATGYRRRYDWLQVPGVCGPDGELLQHHGVSPVRGIYTMGIRFQSRRSSHFIGGVAQDAAELADGRHGPPPRAGEPAPPRRAPRVARDRLIRSSAAGAVGEVERVAAPDQESVSRQQPARGMSTIDGPGPPRTTARPAGPTPAAPPSAAP